MPRPTVEKDTREAILRTAGRMMQMRGYASFSFADVAKVLEVKPAAIHYHFRTKNDLGLALIARYNERYKLWAEDAAALPAVQQLQGYLAMFERFSLDGRVCFEGVLEVEYHALPEEMQQALRKMVLHANNWLAGLLKKGRESGELQFAGSPKNKAYGICARLQGALQNARLLGPQSFNAVVADVRAELIP